MSFDYIRVIRIVVISMMLDLWSLRRNIGGLNLDCKNYVSILYSNIEKCKCFKYAIIFEIEWEGKGFNGLLEKD